MLPTPTVFHLTMHDEPIETFLEREQRSSTGQIGKSLGVALRMAVLPTPTTQDNSGKCRDHGGDLLHELTCGCSRAERRLLPTPVAAEGTKAPAQQTSETKSKTGQVWLSNAAKDMELSWGRFEPAIRRWEQTINRPAPAPTEPDGKDGAHRLSARFTEWLMGLPDGYIVDSGLTRNEALKACGNGVVPQQAKLALEILDVKL